MHHLVREVARLEIAGRYVEIKGTSRVGEQSEVFQATAALRTLSHPNIASLLDGGVEEAAGVYYVVLDWIPKLSRRG